MLPLSHADPKLESSPGCLAFMGGLSPVLYRLLVPARHVKMYAEIQIVGGRIHFHQFLWKLQNSIHFHQFLWKLQNSISAPKCPITEPKIRIWSLLLSNISYHTHSLQIRGHPRLRWGYWKTVPSEMGGGGGVWGRRGVLVSAPLPAQAIRAQVASGYAAGDTILVISPVSLFFSSYSTFLCIAAGWVVVDKNAHTIGAKQGASLHFNFILCKCRASNYS
jgi:hypothetical protein